MTHPLSLYPCEIRNGNVEPSASPLADSSKRAFRYGDGIFETFCVRNNKPLFFDDHCERLMKGLQLMRLPIRSRFEEKLLRHQISVLLESNSTDSGRVRLIVYREASGLYKPADMSSSWVLSITGKVSDQYE